MQKRLWFSSEGIDKMTQHQRTQKGAVLPLVAICFALLLSFAAMAIDLGYLFVGRNELQNAADAAALAGARQLGKIYQEPTCDQTNYRVDVENCWTEDDASKNADNQYLTYDHLTVKHVSAEAAKANKATKDEIIIDASEILIGNWDPSTSTFTEEVIRPIAVKVTARRNQTKAAGPIKTFFSHIFGPGEFPVSATATASLGGKGSAEPGELELPVGVSRTWFDGSPDNWCGDVIKFSPTGDAACAGWLSFNYEPANANTLKEILYPEDHNKHLESPGNEIHDYFEYINGDLSTWAYENLLREYETHGVAVDKVYDPDEFNNDPGNYQFPEPLEDGDSPVPICFYDDPDTTATDTLIKECNAGDEYVDDANPGIQERYPDGHPNCPECTGNLRYAHEWETSIVVYDTDPNNPDCTPSGPMEIYGYADVVVYNVGSPSNKIIAARIKCDIVDNNDTRGGGPILGPLGSIPGLVE